MAHKTQKEGEKRTVKSSLMPALLRVGSESGFPPSPLSPPAKRETAAEIFKYYHTFYESPAAKIGIIRTGLESAAITDFIRLTGLTQVDLALMLSVTEPILRKYIKEGKELSQGLTEHIIQLFELFDKGMDTFGSLQEFKNWLPHHNIGINAKPIELLDTITGINMVINELRRIDYGILA